MSEIVTDKQRCEELIKALIEQKKYIADLQIELAECKLQLMVAVEALEKIETRGLNPDLGQIVDSEHYEEAWLGCQEIAEEALSQLRSEGKE